jgi:hypothetical protein
MDAASPEKPMLTVALDVPSAYILADQATIAQDLQFVSDSCARLLTILAVPEEERDPVVPLALWTAAVITYARCFSKGKRFGLTNEDVQDLPLHGAVMDFHKWIMEEKSKLTAHSPNPFEAAKVAAALAPGAFKDRRVEGIVIYATNHFVMNGNAAQQLGIMAAGLAKQTAEKAEKQQDIVLKDAQQINLDSLYKLPPLVTAPPADDEAGDDSEADVSEADGEA